MSEDTSKEKETPRGAYTDTIDPLFHFAGLAKKIKTLEKLVLAYSGEIKGVESKVERIEILEDILIKLAVRVGTLEKLIVLLASNNGFFIVEKNVKMIGLSLDKKIHKFLGCLPMVSEILGIKKK